MKLKKLLFALGACMLAGTSQAQTPAQWNTPGAGNPIIPGYFADPTIRKFGDTFYIYATTDGTGNGYGPAQVWVSKDFVNWKNVLLNWPTTEVVWAPDVVKESDGKYRYYYCEPCVVHVGESDSPLGPWKNLLGDAAAVLVPDRYVTNAITLDPQLFTDDDGSQYLYFGTWGIYKGFGCGVARLSKDAHAPYKAEEFFDKKRLIPNTEITDFFEAPFVFKKDGKYYFTYSSGSCHDDTYRVQYAVSTEGPMGPYEYKDCILSTNADGTIHGPGHHSILRDDNGDYFIVYHRHNNPHSIHGFHRQICIDKLEFDAEGNILKVVPTHDSHLPASVAKLSKSRLVNLAYQAKTTASSCYSDWFKPEYVADDNNGTLWRSAKTNWDGGHHDEWIQLDLGGLKTFNQVWTQFEYATFFYQYKIETSTDGNNWTLFADKSQNTQQGSPMIDKSATPVKARYIRLTVSDTQKNGHFPAVWNMKVYNATAKNDPSKLLPNPTVDEDAIVRGYPDIHRKDVDDATRAKVASDHKVFELNAEDYKSAGKCQDVNVEIKEKKYALYFDGKHSLTFDSTLPPSMKYNSPYTVCAWTLNPSVGGIETIAEFTKTRNDLSTIELRQGTDPQNGLVAHNASFENSGAPRQCKQGEGKWQFWTVTFDGYNERIYLDGTLVSEKNMFLMIRPQGGITVGSSMDGSNRFSGYLHSLTMYDKSMSAEEITRLYNQPTETTDRMPAVQLGELRAEVVTPSLISLTVVDAQGNQVSGGSISYEYTINGKTVLTTDSPSVLLGVDNAKKQNCTVRVVQESGESTLRTVLNMKKASKSIRQIVNDFSENEGGVLKLESHDTDLGTDKSKNGPMLTETVEGDFVVQAKVVDLMGSEKRTTPAYNEGGIVILDDSSDRQSAVHLGVFPNYNCGNMLTVLHRGRPQYPNRKGWNYDPYLQLQRKGNLIYARTSSDGITWIDMDGSPVDCTWMQGKKLKVGLYQTTYSANNAWVKFDDYKLFIINQ